MGKVYIAGKITGLTNYKELFDIAAKELNSKGYATMNPSLMTGGFEWDEYMHVYFAMIDVCTTCYFLSNWKYSKGAKLEHEYAIVKGKHIEYQED